MGVSRGAIGLPNSPLDAVFARKMYIKDDTALYELGASEFAVLSNDGIAHNTFYRGKYLGIITDNNIEKFIEDHRIEEGKFTDLYLGDIITISYKTKVELVSFNGTSIVPVVPVTVPWVIVGFDIKYTKNSTYGSNGKHHIALLPIGNLLDSAMNKSATTENGYLGSYMNTDILPRIEANLNSTLGAHLLTYNTQLSSATMNGKVSKSVSSSVKVVLPTEMEICGMASITDIQNDIGDGYSKFPIFNYCTYNYLINNMWLRNVADEASFACATERSMVQSIVANDVKSVRPLILIG